LRGARPTACDVRIPVYHKGASEEKRKRVEFRTPDPSANPYLAFAAICAAGLDGIRRSWTRKPVNEDIYKLTPEKRRSLGIKELPGSLLESIESLRATRASSTGSLEDLVETIIDLGMTSYKQVSARPHPYEFYLYFDI